MKKLFLIGILLCVLCSCGSGNAGPANVHEGHEWVDLGLPSGLKWATCNVGASSPEDNGDHYAWGDLNPTTDQYRGTTCGEEINISGNSQYDVARAKWGGSWRMPTKEEFGELIDNCTWELTKGGYKLTGPNGNSIFLPGRGRHYGPSDSNYVVYEGSYWSASPHSHQASYALSFISQGDCIYLSDDDCMNGFSVRGVIE